MGVAIEVDSPLLGMLFGEGSMGIEGLRATLADEHHPSTDTGSHLSGDSAPELDAAYLAWREGLGLFNKPAEGHATPELWLYPHSTQGCGGVDGLIMRTEEAAAAFKERAYSPLRRVQSAGQGAHPLSLQETLDLARRTAMERESIGAGADVLIDEATDHLRKYRNRRDEVKWFATSRKGNEPASTRDGLAAGVGALGQGFGDAVAGLVVDTVEGGKQGGFFGVLGGFGRGAVGGALSIGKGVTGFVGNVATGARHSIERRVEAHEANVEANMSLHDAGDAHPLVYPPIDDDGNELSPAAFGIAPRPDGQA